MGYRCPVCEDPQADGIHLANHLAFTAMLRGGDHEEWLDEQFPEWEQLGEDALADRVVERAEEAEYPQIFEDTTGTRQRDRNHPTDATDGVSLGSVSDGELDEEAREIFERAREMTRKRRNEDENEEDG